MISERRLLGVGVLSLLAQGCFVFDDKFYKDLEAREGDAGQLGNLLDSSVADAQAGSDAKVPDGSSNQPDGGKNDTELHLVDTCGDPNMYLLSETHAPIEVATTGFSDDVSSTRCFASVPGPEGWLAIDMVAGDRWHFHVKPTNKVGMGQAVQNPALYMRQDCNDDRALCNPGTYLNLCGNGQDEHFTFEATSTTRWYFALDDVNQAAGTYNLTVAKPVCGNSVQEHNEACEDGNTDNGDGCSSDCRVELRSASDTHIEVNDDWTTANILSALAVGSPQSVLGDIGGFCDLDIYAFNVPQDGTDVTVTITNALGQPCAGNAPELSPISSLRLLNSDGRSERGHTESNDPTVCPSIDGTHPFAQDLAAGLYYLSLSGDETKGQLTYKLTVTLSQ